MWIYNIRNLRVNQWENTEKQFLSDIASGYKDATDMQNDLLYICLFTDFAWF